MVEIKKEYKDTIVGPMNNKLLLCFLGILSGSATLQANPTKETYPTQEVELIIFVHGTIKPPDISFSSLVKIMHDDMDNSLLALATERLRQDPFFYRGQPIQELGLKPIVMEDKPQEVTIRTAQTIVDIYKFQYKLHKKDTIKHLYYTFGWNGLLSNTKRYQASQKLYNELTKELKRLKSQNLKPKVTLVTYSHGGNVALYLARAQETMLESEIGDNTLSIDNLIMLACPIQKETDYFVESPMFKKVYNIFSKEDFVQVWDLFSSNEQFFSQRMFKNRRTFTVPSKVCQIQVRATKKIRGVSPNKTTQDLSRICKIPEKYFEHRDPGHMEIGGFSWGNYWYRDIFPLFPFSVQALVPTIIHTIEEILPTTNYLIFDFIPTYNCALLTDNQSKQKEVKLLWTSQERQDLWNTISSSVPLDYTYYNQEDHIAQALRSARDILLTTKNGRKYRYPHNKTLARLLRKADKSLLVQNTHNTKRVHSIKHTKKPHRLTHNLLYT